MCQKQTVSPLLGLASVNETLQNARKHIPLLPLLVLLLISGTLQAQPDHSIAAQGITTGFAFDGSNFLAGVESHLTTPPTIGAQMVSSNGTRVGSFISTGRTGIATAIAFDGTNYLLIWEDNEMGTLVNESYQVFGQFISKAGTPVGSPFNISGLGIQFDAIKPMAFGGGKYLVTYTRLIQPGLGADSSNICISGRMVDSNGAVGNEFRISAGYGKESEVAFDGSNFFVIWRESINDNEIRGRFVSPAGVPGKEISVNSSPAPSDNPKAVVFGGTNYLVVWNEEVGGSGSREWDCLGQFVTTNGTLVGGPITITSEPGAQLPTGVAFDGNRYLAVWVDMQNFTNWNCFGQFINRNGSLYGGKLTISTDPKNQMCGVGFANGGYVVVVNSGLMMKEDGGGFSDVDYSYGRFIPPPPVPHAMTADAAFGIKMNQFGFTISGYDNATVVVEACTNLTNPDWIPIKTNTLTGGSSYFSDPQWINHGKRYYRLVEP